MLYQTHHQNPLFFHFKTFSSSSIHPLLPSATTTPPPAPTSLSPLSSSHSSSQVENKKMACVEGALKGSFGKEMALKSNHHQALLLEDLWAANGQSGVVVSVEDFSVDDLLDFSKMGGADEDEKEKTKEGEKDNNSCVSLSSPNEQQQQQQLTTKENSNNHGGNLGFKDDFGSSELSVPVDDVANLEWLSHFVEDSFSEYSLPFPAGNLTAKPKSTPEKKPTTTEEPPSTKTKNPCFATPVPAKARTKRTRTGGRRWSFGSTTESSSSSSSSSTTSTTSSPSTSWLIYTTPSHIVDSFNSLTRPPVKKQKGRIASESGGGGYGGGTTHTQPARRCSHCGVQKTPQWRAGPQGAKTLCNACGVRFKSGRLLPEYRPACSPTFSSEVHSNHHRKVLEMRKKKEPDGSEPGLAPAVTSF